MIDPTIVGVLAGAVGTVAGVLGKTFAARTARGEREDSALARVLERRDEDCRRLGDRLDQSRTESDLRGAQVGDLGARVEMLEARDAEREARVLKLDERNDDCERRNAALARRVFLLERNRVTPANDTPAVMPTQHEEVGGHE